MSDRYRPSVTVAAVIEAEGRFLLVEEHTSDGLRLNQPAGHLEAGETLVEACRREVLEETAHEFEPEGLVAIYQWPAPGGAPDYVRFAFHGRLGVLHPDRALDDGIVRTLWMTGDEIRACPARHRSLLVGATLDDWLQGRRIDLSCLRMLARGI